jgi:LemA protein
MGLIYILIAVVVVLGLWIMGAYNKLIKWRNRVQESWADIDVQLKRRHDLIPNLVNIVKGYATHEQETLENVINARNSAMSAGGPEELAAAENMLTGALKSIFALSEAYPDLKANENFLELQRELSDTENKVQAARRFYNTNVNSFNTTLQTFPTNMIAGMFSFTAKEFFEVGDDAERAVPEVSFK